ncbi:MAG: transcription elongation factor GreA [Deltaproteobacteria bacterium]|nr:MAG: transcription elongation factor GreA [Deltaproteobacteria bacterium]
MREKVPMTPRSHDQLQKELHRLKTRERPAMVQAIKVARAHGDLSENAEYDAAKEGQGHIESRILMLEDKLARAQVVDLGDQTPDRVLFGTTVVLEDLSSGDEVTYTLVGEDEADIRQALLSVKSPVGRALIGKRVDDEVTVEVPSGVKQYEIRDIRLG